MVLAPSPGTGHPPDLPTFRCSFCSLFAFLTVASFPRPNFWVTFASSLPPTSTFLSSSGHAGRKEGAGSCWCGRRGCRRRSGAVAMETGAGGAAGGSFATNQRTRSERAGATRTTFPRSLAGFALFSDLTPLGCSSPRLLGRGCRFAGPIWRSRAREMVPAPPLAS